VPSMVVLVALIAGGLYYRSHRAKPLTDKDTIVLADFANSTGGALCLISVAFILSISLPWELGNPRRFGVRFLVVPECGVKAKRDDWLKEMAER
jgi:hypothetical protein